MINHESTSHWKWLAFHFFFRWLIEASDRLTSASPTSSETQEKKKDKDKDKKKDRSRSRGRDPWISHVCLKMLCKPIVPNGFADHYPY